MHFSKQKKKGYKNKQTFFGKCKVPTLKAVPVWCRLLPGGQLAWLGLFPILLVAERGGSQLSPTLCPPSESEPNMSYWE